MKMNFDKEIELLVENNPNDYTLGSKLRTLYSERKLNTIQEDKTTRS
jgi:hypothetical protein